MSADPKFTKKIGKLIDLKCRETRDGCAECRAARGYCDHHKPLITDMVFNPRKYEKQLNQPGPIEPEEGHD